MSKPERRNRPTHGEVPFRTSRSSVIVKEELADMSAAPMVDSPQLEPRSAKNTGFEAASFTTPMVDLNDKTILVTGGTGSFGQSFIRTVIDNYRPRRLIVFSRDEMKQYEMQCDPRISDHSFMRFFLGDVRDVQRLELALRDVDIVIHSAALKQVPAAEYNPLECVATNIRGAENIVLSAIRCNVQHVLALSTDKAANPANLYGATKLAAEKIFIAANALSGDRGCRFSVVRYGNVISSRGSVIPWFQRLIDNGADFLPVTDQRMTRFLIALSQGVNFVLSSLAMMRGGEVFVPKIPSVRIAQLAEWMAPHLPQRFVGIRPGEKLHEILVTQTESRTTLELADRFVITPDFPWWDSNELLGMSAHRLEDSFQYSSDNNFWWLDRTRFDQLIRM
jgi:UDP-N-acetylglucosamine 4,6-dehydratase